MFKALTNKRNTKYGTVRRVELFETNKARGKRRTDQSMDFAVDVVVIVSDFMHKWPISDSIFILLHRAVASNGKCSDVCYMKMINGR